MIGWRPIVCGWCLGCLLAAQGAAGETSFRKFAGEFLATGVGARPHGMGGAFVALADDGSAGYWNPAGLARIDFPQFMAMHASRFSGEVNFDYFSAFVPYRDNQSLGISITRLGIDDIPDTRRALLDFGVDGIPDTDDFGEDNGLLNPGNPGDPFSPGERIDPTLVTFFSNADYAVYVHYARRYSDRLSFGGNFKFIRRGLGEYSAVGLGFDCAVLYVPNQRWRFGVNLQDLTSTLVAWNTGERELIAPTCKLGIGYRLPLPWGDSAVTPLFDSDIRFENRRFASQLHLGRISFDQHVGAELDLRRRVYLRGGYSDTGAPSAGAGVRLRAFHIDYAFTAFNSIEELGNSHLVSMTFTLQSERFQRR